MSAETLRKAAERLRERATGPLDDRLIPGPWSVGKWSDLPRLWAVTPALDEDYDNIATTPFEAEANYIATMHPGVGLALADVLDESAAVWDDIDVDTIVRDDSQIDRLHRLARLILGGDS